MSATSATSPSGPDECPVPVEHREWRLEYLGGFAAGLRGQHCAPPRISPTSPFALQRIAAFKAGRQDGLVAGAHRTPTGARRKRQDA